MSIKAKVEMMKLQDIDLKDERSNAVCLDLQEQVMELTSFD